MREFLVIAACAAILAGCGRQTEETTSAENGSAPEEAAVSYEADRDRLETYVRDLSSDRMEGREAGTAGFDMAADYVAKRYAELGLQPLPNGTYFQEVPMVEYGRETDFGGVLTFSGEGAPEGLNAGDHYLLGASDKTEEGTVEAPLVFVGFGLVSEDHGRNDYEGLDVDGKIVVYLSGAPKFLNSEERAHYSSNRATAASERGAIGSISLFTPTLQKRITWERLKEVVVGDTSMSWIMDDGTPFSRAPNLEASAVINLEGAAMLFENMPVKWAEIEAAAEDEQGMVQGFDMGISAKIDFQSHQRDLTSANVIGILPGTDPSLANEYIVVTAHLDHDGVKPTEEEGDDEIFNGAMDNATGVASVMEVARLLAQDPPRRPILFVGLTAEEKGLVGSDYLAQNPPMETGEFVANINLDMPIITYDFSDVVAFGGERSTMYPIVEEATKRAGLTLSPDPMPDEGFFTRSDQYRFVQQGIPSLYIDLGFGNGGEEAQNLFLKEHYHRVSDEADLVNYDALRKFAQVNYEVTRAVANMDERPRWKEGDFFGRTFGGPME